MQGVLFMLAAMTCFALQDGLSKLLAHEYASIYIVMIRYWTFAAFVIALSARRPGGLRRAFHSERPMLQIFRSLLLVAQIALVIWTFDQVGLAATHSIFAIYPLLTAALGAAVLGERMDAVRWGALGLGFVGVIIIVRPGAGDFQPLALVALVCAAMFACYNIATRAVGQRDPASVSFFYTGVVGAVGASLVGPFYAVPMAYEDWLPMGVLCVSGALGHWFLIKAFAAAEAGSLQPYAYWQAALASLIGWLAFGEELELAMVVGAGIIISAGLVSIAQERRLRRRHARAAVQPSE